MSSLETYCLGIAAGYLKSSDLHHFGAYYLAPNVTILDQNSSSYKRTVRFAYWLNNRNYEKKFQQPDCLTEAFWA